MRHRSIPALAVLPVLVAALLAGCSSDSDGASSSAAPAGTQAAAPAGTAAAPGSLYARAERPAATGATNPIDASWIDADGNATTVPDGIYWATQAGDGVVGDSVRFDLQQAFFGEFCVAHFGDTASDDCANDYGVVPEPHAFLVVPVTELTVVSVADAATQINYSIDGAELARITAGEPPADPAPDGYTYTDFPFLITITGGAVQSAVQIWLP